MKALSGFVNVFILHQTWASLAEFKIYSFVSENIRLNEGVSVAKTNIIKVDEINYEHQKWRKIIQQTAVHNGRRKERKLSDMWNSAENRGTRKSCIEWETEISAKRSIMRWEKSKSFMSNCFRSHVPYSLNFTSSNYVLFTLVKILPSMRRRSLGSLTIFKTVTALTIEKISKLLNIAGKNVSSQNEAILRNKNVFS